MWVNMAHMFFFKILFLLMCRCVYLHVAEASGMVFPGSWSDRWLQVIWGRSWARNSHLLENGRCLWPPSHFSDLERSSQHLFVDCSLHACLWFFPNSLLLYPFPHLSFSLILFHFTSHPRVTLSLQSFQLVSHSFLALVHYALTIPGFFTTCPPGQQTCTLLLVYLRLNLLSVLKGFSGCPFCKCFFIPSAILFRMPGATQGSPRLIFQFQLLLPTSASNHSKVIFTLSSPVLL